MKCRSEQPFISFDKADYLTGWMVLQPNKSGQFQLKIQHSYDHDRFSVDAVQKKDGSQDVSREKLLEFCKK